MICRKLYVHFPYEMQMTSKQIDIISKCQKPPIQVFAKIVFFFFFFFFFFFNFMIKIWNLWEKHLQKMTSCNKFHGLTIYTRLNPSFLMYRVVAYKSLKKKEISLYKCMKACFKCVLIYDAYDFLSHIGTHVNAKMICKYSWKDGLLNAESICLWWIRLPYFSDVVFTKMLFLTSTA